MNKFSMPIGILPRGDKNFQKKTSKQGKCDRDVKKCDRDVKKERFRVPS